MEFTKHGYHIMTAKLLNSEQCKKIIDFIEDNMNDFMYTQPKKGYNTNSMGRMLNDLSHKKEFKEIDDMLFKSVGEAIDCFMVKSIKINQGIFKNIQDSGYELRKITGPTREHVDSPEIEVYNSIISYRVGTLVISLAGTGDYLLFPEFDIKVKLEEGTFVFFPPYWTHVHSSEWSGTDTYRIQTWIMNEKPA